MSFLNESKICCLSKIRKKTKTKKNQTNSIISNLNYISDVMVRGHVRRRAVVEHAPEHAGRAIAGSRLVVELEARAEHAGYGHARLAHVAAQVVDPDARRPVRDVSLFWF